MPGKSIFGTRRFGNRVGEEVDVVPGGGYRLLGAQTVGKSAPSRTTRLPHPRLTGDGDKCSNIQVDLLLPFLRERIM